MIVMVRVEPATMEAAFAMSSKLPREGYRVCMERGGYGPEREIAFAESPAEERAMCEDGWMPV